MNFKSLRRKAEQMIEKRGGNQSVKEDAQELMDIAKGQGTFGDKAKRAGEALKDPGAKGPDDRQPPPRP
jgi:general stress protein YciG